MIQLVIAPMMTVGKDEHAVVCSNRGWWLNNHA